MTAPILPACHEGFRPHRLWSLWEMYEVHLGRLTGAIHFLGSTNQALTIMRDTAKMAFGCRERSDFIRWTATLEEIAREIGLFGVGTAASQLSEEAHLLFDPIEDSQEIFVSKSDAKYLRFIGTLQKVNLVVDAETSSQYFLSVDPKNLHLWKQNDPPFGKNVLAKFPSVEYDVAEAAKCLALDRSTASAFHSIRCLEAGIRALSRCLAIPDPTRASGRNWGAMLATLNTGISARWPGSSARLTGDGEFFDNAYAALAAMQNPWRNATMHLDQKYTEEEARHIFDVVRGFMNRLANRMDENGLPLA